MNLSEKKRKLKQKKRKTEKENAVNRKQIKKDCLNLLITKLMRSTMARNTTKLQYEQKMGNFLSKYWGVSQLSTSIQV